MALFNRPVKRGRPDRPLTAAGARIDLKSPNPLMIRRREWQSAAWAYRDSVPELRFACLFVANSLGRLRMFAAENQPRGEDPIPLSRDGSESSISAMTQRAAMDAVERLDLDARGSSMLARLGENLEVAAEGYLLGERDPSSPTGETWSVRSVSEVRVTGSGQLSLVEPGAGGGSARQLNAADVELLRIWRPHPNYYDWPDSELATLLDTCEELRIYDRQLRAAGRSRISAGTALYVPEEMSLTRAGQAPVSSSLDAVTEDDDPFMQELVAAMIEPIGEEDSPSSVVPMLLRGPAFIEDKPAKDLIGKIELGRVEDPRLLEKRAAAAEKFARNINLPPEIVQGLGDTNHWSSWSIDANLCKNHIEPRAEVLCDSLTMAYLRPMLRAMGCPADEVNRVVLWFDPSELVENPNRGQDARDGHAAGVLNDDALARYLGFAEEDRPGLEERVFRAIEQRALSDQQVPLLLLLGGMDPTSPIYVAAEKAAAAGTALKAAQNGHQVINSPDSPPTPDQPTPTRPIPRKPLPIAGSATPARWRVKPGLCQELAQIDATLTTTLLAHADATVGRAVERTANRIRSRAIRDSGMAAAFKGRPVLEVLQELGTACMDYQDTKDLDDSLDSFRAMWTASTTDAAARIADVSADLMGVSRDSRLTDALTGNARTAWQWLEQQLRRLVQAILFGGPPTHLPGEKVAGVVPASVIRGALAQAGGLTPDSPGITAEGVALGPAPIAGMANGHTAGQWRTERGAVDLGMEWSYFGLERDPFPGHRALSGRRFTSWTDEVLEVRPGDEWIGSHYHCGDHPGCLCGFMPILAVPMDPKEGRALADAAQLTESKSQRDSRILLAEADDAAGRTNTVAQQQRDARAELMRLRRIHIEERESK